MRHTASNINELKHWFANQFVLVFDRTTTDIPSVVDVRRNRGVTSEGKCGNVRYEPMTQWAWEQHELYTPESLRPSILFSWYTPIAVIFPTQRVLLVTSTTHSSYTSRHMPRLSDIADRSQWTQIDACLDPQTIDDRHTSYVDQRGGYRTISGPTQWVAEAYKECTDLVARAATRRQRKHAVDDLLLAGSRYETKVTTYAKRFNITPPEPPVSVEQLDALRASEKERRAVEEAKAAERKAARRAVLEARRSDIEGWLSQWRSGFTVKGDGVSGVWAAWPDINELLGDYPRLRVIGNEVQTSFGARVSVKQAARAWPVLQRLHKTVAAGKHTATVDVRELSFAPYRTQSFDGDTLVVGCHSIPWSEIELIAPQVMAAAAASTAIEEQTV